MKFSQDVQDQIANAVGNQIESSLLLAVFEHLPVLVHAVKETQVFTFWNRESERVTGYSAQEIVGRADAWQLLYPEMTQHAQRRHTQAQRTGEARAFESVLATKAGAKRRIAWSWLDAGEFGLAHDVRWFIGVNVTARVQAERQVRMREQMLRMVFHYLPDMACLKDGEGRWLLSSAVAREGLGLTEAELHGRTNLELADQGHVQRDALR